MKQFIIETETPKNITCEYCNQQEAIYAITFLSRHPKSKSCMVKGNYSLKLCDACLTARYW